LGRISSIRSSRDEPRQEAPCTGCFFAYVAATFGPLFYFGVLAGASVLAGALYDLFLLPALLLLGQADAEGNRVQVRTTRGSVAASGDRLGDAA
jgi:hypothetical protein